VHKDACVGAMLCLAANPAELGSLSSALPCKHAALPGGACAMPARLLLLLPLTW
jgi:hypothetical protein